MNETNEIPIGWVEATLGELLAPLQDGRILHQGWSPRCEKQPSKSEDEWGVLKTTAIQDGEFLPEHNKRLPDNLEPRPGIEVAEGDLLITCAGPRIRCGVPCLVRNTRKKLMLSGKMYRFRVHERLMSPPYVEAFLRSVEAQEAINRMKTGSSDSGLNLTHDRFRPLRIRVAPLPEQNRIVAKIEELFSDLDAGVAALERAKANLKRYRAAVLKSAVEGKLTEQWRAEHPDVEPASELLQRILTERRTRWEADQLAKYEAKGKNPPKGWKQKYKEPVEPDVKGLPELPKGWCWATVDALGEVVGGITKGQKRSSRSMQRVVPYLRVANVQRSYLDLDVIKTIPATEDEIKAYRLLPGDILFNEGGDRDKLGRGWVWKGELEECIHQNHVFRVRPFLTEIKSEFLSHHGNTFGKLWFMRTGKQSVNLASINMTVLRQFPVPVPPSDEQSEIVSLVGILLDQIDRCEIAVESQLIRSSRLRQSILKRAFEGKLVPQDSNDEPASELLKRIKAEREAAESNGTSPQKKRTNLAGTRQTSEEVRK